MRSWAVRVAASEDRHPREQYRVARKRDQADTRKIRFHSGNGPERTELLPTACRHGAFGNAGASVTIPNASKPRFAAPSTSTATGHPAAAMWSAELVVSGPGRTSGRGE